MDQAVLEVLLDRAVAVCAFITDRKAKGSVCAAEAYPVIVNRVSKQKRARPDPWAPEKPTVFVPCVIPVGPRHLLRGPQGCAENTGGAPKSLPLSRHTLNGGAPRIMIALGERVFNVEKRTHQVFLRSSL
jgi:hypothetical protein